MAARSIWEKKSAGDQCCCKCLTNKRNRESKLSKFGRVISTPLVVAYKTYVDIGFTFFYQFK